jgi:hypothetical protein
MKPNKSVRKTFDNLSLPVLVINRDYEIVDANRAAVSHVDRPEFDVIGQPCFEVTHGSAEPCWRTGEVACPVKGAFESKRRVRAIHKHRIGGHLVVEEIVATPLSQGTGPIEYVVEEFRDVTQLLDLREGMLPICGSCKKIRDDEGVWRRIETYIHDHTGADFSHSLCPECLESQFPESEETP